MKKSSKKLVEREAVQPRWLEEEQKKSGNVHRSRCKNKGKAEVTCYQCGWNGHKKPNCRYYKAELENTCDQKKMESENEAHNCWRVAAPDLHSLSSLLSFFYIISLPRLFSL